MRIYVISDLHFEGRSRSDLDNFNTDLEDRKNSILVLAGDIASAEFSKYGIYGDYHQTGTVGDCLRPILKRVAPLHKHVIYVMGNHEHYNSFIGESTSEIRNVCGEFDNVHVLENNSVVIDSVAFVGCTLWTSMSRLRETNPVCISQIESLVNDYRLIYTHRDQQYPVKLTGRKTIEYNRTSERFLLDEVRKFTLDSSVEKIVVVTHHAPSFNSDQAHSHQITSHAYCNDLDLFVGYSEIDLWIHGHTHINVDYMIGETRVVANCIGYHRGNKQPNWTYHVEV